MFEQNYTLSIICLLFYCIHVYVTNIDDVTKINFIELKKINKKI
jgi:hypothetical protein